MDIFMDMMEDQETPFVEVVEPDKDNSYYQGLGIHILKQLIYEFDDEKIHIYLLLPVVEDCLNIEIHIQDPQANMYLQI